MMALPHFRVVALILAVVLSAPTDVLAQSDALMQAYRQYKALHEQGRYGEAEHFARKALELGEKEYGSEHSNTGIFLNNLADLYHEQGKYAEAEPLHKRVVAIFEKALGPEHPDVATSLSNLAELYHAQGRYAEAEPLHERALAIREKALGPEHPHLALSPENYGIM